MTTYDSSVRGKSVAREDLSIESAKQNSFRRPTNNSRSCSTTKRQSGSDFETRPEPERRSTLSPSRHGLAAVSRHRKWPQYADRSYRILRPDSLASGRPCQHTRTTNARWETALPGVSRFAVPDRSVDWRVPTPAVDPKEVSPQPDHEGIVDDDRGVDDRVKVLLGGIARTGVFLALRFVVE